MHSGDEHSSDWFSDDWPVERAAAGWCRADGRTDRTAASHRPFALASVTKPLVAYALLIAVEEGTIRLDDVPTLESSSAPFTVRHLLSHASGLGPEAGDPAIRPESRRVYSNLGFELLGAHLEIASDMPIAEYVRLAVFEPLGMTNTHLTGSPAHGATSTVDDLLSFVAELLTPRLIDPITRDDAVRPQFPLLEGILPGFGVQSPNPWGLGFELKGVKAPHWTSPENAPTTFGHFGRAGTMFWVDPVAAIGCVALTNREFGSWAATSWPILGTRVLREGHSEQVDLPIKP